MGVVELPLDLHLLALILATNFFLTLKVVLKISMLLH